jgi:benzil reductase ((S)-benzoin forming)
MADLHTVLITGVSSGVGHGLAQAYLDRGWKVFGTSRRTPEDLRQRDGFVFRSLDLRDHDAIPTVLKDLLAGTSRLVLVVLNAGVLGRFGDMADADLDELSDKMDVNVWAHKVILDTLFKAGIETAQVVAISSGAAVNGNRGWGGYAISKAALNMLTKLYAAERPETHFCALAPGIIDTAMQEQLCSREPDPRYPSVEVLRSKRHTSEMPTPDEAAERLVRTFERLPSLVESGAFADIRQLPPSAQ